VRSGSVGTDAAFARFARTRARLGLGASRYTLTAFVYRFSIGTSSMRAGADPTGASVYRDPVASKPKPQLFLDDDGRPILERRGVPRRLLGSFVTDSYHFLRTASWTRVTLLLAAIFLLVNLCFALVLWVGSARLANSTGGLADCFWFSVQTMATIGYGHLAPLDILSNVMVTVESFVGILLTAMVTGVFFARFATPSPRVIFCKNAVLTDQEGSPTLMFRMANARSTAIVEATIRVYFLRDEILASGERLRRIYDLSMRRTSTPVFSLSWMAYHVVDRNSPLWGATAASLEAAQAVVIVTFTGIDDKLAATVHTRTTYRAARILLGHRLRDILGIDPDTGRRYLDYARFDDVEPATLSPWSEGQAAAG
jgi:inward rectifier potassium channel